MEGAILATWRRPVNEVADQAIGQLQTMLSYVDGLREADGPRTVTGCELQVNATGNHIGGVLMIKGEVEGLVLLQADEEYRERIMRLTALFEDFETNVTIGGAGGAADEGLQMYRSAFEDLALAGRG